MSAMPQGSWFGHFSSVYGSERIPTELTLEQVEQLLRGKGKDADGRYTIEGAIDGHKVRWIKRYVAGPGKGAQIAYLGGWDPAVREIGGRWRLVDTSAHGTFALRPGVPQDVVGDEPIETLLTPSSRCSLDLEALRFDGEHTMLAALAEDPAFVSAVRHAKAAEAVGSLAPSADPFAQLFPRTRLDRSTLPIVFDALDQCKTVLGFDGLVELYVENNGQVNARVEATPTGTIRITFTSAALDIFDLDELTAIMGHELGHALLGHIDTRIASDAELSGVTQLRRLALARYQELSADRVGLLCCGSLDKVLIAEFMLHSGVTRRDRIGSAEMLEQGALAAVTRGEGKVDSTQDGYDTHPCGAFRTLAAAWFGRSLPFYTLRSVAPPPDAIDEASLEMRVATLVAAMNPAALDRTTHSDEIDRFIALSALAISESDRNTTAEETRAIRSLSEGVARALDAIAHLSFEERQLEVLDLADALVVTLPPLVRERIVEDLTMIAQVDGELSEPELMVLSSIGVLLDVSSTLPGDLLSEIACGLD